MPGPSVCCMPDPMMEFLHSGPPGMRMQPWKIGAAAQAREVNPLMRIADLSLHRANRCFVHTGGLIPR